MAEYEDRINGRDFLLLLAENDGELAGFKLGYALDGSSFYSWLGGIHPNHRRQGIAKQLLQEQERLLLQSGYTMVTVKSMNRYAGMMILLLSHGYEITGYDPNQGQSEAKILFSKTLVALKK